MIILNGSQAAAIRGCLPPWREGSTLDHDLCSNAEGRAIIKAFLFGHFKSVDLRGDDVNFGAICDRRHVFDVHGDEAIWEALCGTRDLLPVNHLGLNVWAISEKTQLAIKLGYYEHIPFHFEKNTKDIEYWSSRVTLDPEHLRVQEAMKSLADRMWPLEQSTSGPSTSKVPRSV